MSFFASPSSFTHTNSSGKISFLLIRNTANYNNRLAVGAQAAEPTPTPDSWLVFTTPTTPTLVTPIPTPTPKPVIKTCRRSSPSAAPGASVTTFAARSNSTVRTRKAPGGDLEWLAADVLKLDNAEFDRQWRINGFQ